MYLYLATDDKRKVENQWFLGVSKSTNDKIKEKLFLDRKSGAVDFVIESPQAKEIFRFFMERNKHEVISKNTILIEGNHAHLAQLLIQITHDYEAEHPSLRRSVLRWFKSVDS